MSQPSTCWVCTTGGKAHVKESADSAHAKVVAALDLGHQWIRFSMPNGGEAHLRTEDVTCINTHVDPRNIYY